MTFAILAIIGLFVGWALVNSAEDRRTARLDAAFHAAGAGAAGTPAPVAFPVFARSPFADSVERLRELLAEPTPSPAITARSQPVVVLDNHVITLSAGAGAFLLIPTHEVRSLVVGLVPVADRGRSPRMVWGITLTVVRGDQEASIALVPRGLFGGWPNAKYAADIGRDIHARIWPPQPEPAPAVGIGPDDVGVSSSEPVPRGLPVPASMPRGTGAWSPVLAGLALIVLFQVVPIAVGNTRAIGWIVNGEAMSAWPAVGWWALVLALIAGGALLIRGWMRRLRWARAQR